MSFIERLIEEMSEEHAAKLQEIIDFAESYEQGACPGFVNLPQDWSKHYPMTMTQILGEDERLCVFTRVIDGEMCSVLGYSPE
ncbi:TPA: hypothetical protein JLG68_001362 [Escherichia coli]|nr:hypothetical protein [Escherichia coli]